MMPILMMIGRLGSLPEILNFVPSWIFAVVGAIPFIIPLLKLIANNVRDAKDIWNALATPERRRQIRTRGAAAAYIQEDLARQNVAESWNDERFAELEAEVEAEGGRLSRWFLWRRPTLRRERSLTAALRGSSETRVLLQGDPGSGKSVALRHLALHMAERAAASAFRKQVIPLYVNLRTLSRSPGNAINSAMIREHVLTTINRQQNELLRKFLTENFDAGLEAGDWLFLFDSFDEIPEVLAAADDDYVVRAYSDALAEFLSPFNRCMAVIASREFRAPLVPTWPRFRVLPLSDRRRRQLIRKAVSSVELGDQIESGLRSANLEIDRISRNPLFLGLLCDHVARERTFPDGLHVVLESYVDARLARDRPRIWKQHGVIAPIVRTAAEEIAAFMLTQGTGLEIPLTLLERHAAELSAEPFDACVDALVSAGLARVEETGPHPLLAFAHRRFQEYFATCVVLRKPDLIAVESLLTDGRWRETAIVLLQAHSGKALHPVLEAAERYAEQFVQARNPDEDFRWPQNALHVMGLLQGAFAARITMLPNRVRQQFGALLQEAIRCGGILDRKWAVEVAGLAPQHVLQRLLRLSLMSSSRVLADAAFAQTARLRTLPPDIERAIRLTLLQAFRNGTLFGDRHAIAAFLKRLPRPERLLASLRVLLVIPWVDAGSHLALAAFVIAWLTKLGPSKPLAVLAADLAFLVFLLLLSATTQRYTIAPLVPARDREWVPLQYMALPVRALAILIAIGLSMELPWAYPCVAAVVWPNLALSSVRHGAVVTHSYWAFLVPFVPLVRLARSIGRAGRTVVSTFRPPPFLWTLHGLSPRHREILWPRLVRKRRWYAFLSELRWAKVTKAIASGCAGILVAAGCALILMLIIMYGGSVPWAGIRWGLVGTAVLIMLGVAADSFRVWSLLRDAERGCTVGSFRADLRQLVLRRNQARLVREYRRRQLLRDDPASVEALRLLCTEVERRLTARGGISTTTVYRWLLQRFDRKINHTRLLDELMLLAESLRGRTA